MQTPILSVRSVDLSVGGKVIFNNGDLSILNGDRMGLVGRNGVGKTTCLRFLAGQIEPDSGKLIKQTGLRIGYLEQDISTDGGKSVYQFVADVSENETDEYILTRISSVLDSLKLFPEKLMGQLSGGEARRAALARAIALNPDLLLLDEPTNHLDMKTIEWLEKWLLSFKGSVVLVSHDRTLLRKFARRTIWLYEEQIRIHGGGFDSFEAWSDGIRVSEDVTARKHDQRLHEEERWLNRGVTARRKRNQGRLRKLEALRTQRREANVREAYTAVIPKPSEQKGSVVLEAKGISMRYGNQQVLREFSFRVKRGDRVAITGPNGAGKTTLLRLLIRDLAPQSGGVTLGSAVQPLYFDQQREVVNPQHTLWQTLCPQGGDIVDIGGKPQHVVGYLKKFLFAEGQLRKPIASLSGGERNRLMLAKMFAGIGNLFGLDEPTNDLDIETLELLQEVIGEYQGTVLFVSHDREFIDRIATGILVLDGTGSISQHIGGYSDYLETKPILEEQVSKKKVRKKPRPAKQRTNLSYKESRELELLPEEIDGLSQRFQDLEKILSDSDLYRRDRPAFDKITNEAASVEAEIRRCETRWMELEEKQEALPGPASKSGP